MASSTLLRMVPCNGCNGVVSANRTSNSHKPWAGSRIRFTTTRKWKAAGGSSIRAGSSTCGNAVSDKSRTSPWLMLPPSIEDGDNSITYNFYSLAEDKVHKINNNKSQSSEVKPELPEKYVGSNSRGWLALSNPTKGEQFLYNPISDRRINLPSIEAGDDNAISKLIISDDDEEEQDFRVMIIHHSLQKLAFCRPAAAAAAAEWTTIGEPFIFLDDKYFERAYEDIVYSAAHKLFFCVTCFGDFEAWNLQNPENPRSIPITLSADKKNFPWGSAGRLDEALLKRDCHSIKYLVVSEHDNRLFLIRRFICDQMYPGGHGKVKSNNEMMITYRTMSFDVHEIEREKGEMRYMETSLDGLAMFIGVNHGFAIHVNAAKGKLKPNCIYFTDAKEYTTPYWDKDSPYGGHDIGIFDYVERDFSPCFYPIEERCFTVNQIFMPGRSGADKIKRIVPPPMWFNPPPLV
ncbi:hypothetical protein MIMGU_mgv1a021849mg [Erythranthe guttata]|uniref:KIB1-4 beta-propeller domain-containing protein n=1 Tax=Erythranthe guttata TaxID=4155 RepID=A0A022RMH7_ERYGU|nr:PREDICTED: uncharacterized protein LOC105954928 [Erythranthe guttata]EYU40175.1 hypothetical protein MIMGU_mgv1a021849mg [Erythranthe guttata]|eukprot:XP_012834067.1 PREDICTED: uncharacterized protein LOC105954928 [Erythranthe guttata]